jgi:hypothetical protein
MLATGKDWYVTPPAPYPLAPRLSPTGEPLSNHVDIEAPITRSDRSFGAIRVTRTRVPREETSILGTALA